MNCGHFIQFHDTSILAMKSGCMEHIKKVTEVELHSDNINREEDFSLSKSQKPLLQTLKK